MNTIFLLYPTVRPAQFAVTHGHWVRTADNPSNLVTMVITNADAPEYMGFDPIIYTAKRGVAAASYELSRVLEADRNDIVVLVSDDMFSPQHWDTWLRGQLHDKTAGLLVNDGYVLQDAMTLPIMTYGCLVALNKVIYHPTYLHQYSDNELFYNLRDLGLLIDARSISPVFEHRHWVMNKRKHDEHDTYYAAVVSQDAANWTNRQKLPVCDRLKV